MPRAHHVNRDVSLDVENLQDIPDFYLRLGQALNGEGGYYGGGLDALDDCLCSGFGVEPPFVLRIRNSTDLEHGFRPEVVAKWVAASRSHAGEFDDASSRGIAPASIEWNYLQDLLQVFADHRVEVIFE